MIIAIDGPAASGKGTLAKQIAHAYNLGYLDTGLLYRAVAKMLIDAGKATAVNADIAAEMAAKVDLAKFNPKDLRSIVVADLAAVVAEYPKVRSALLKLQQDFAKNPLGAVLDGRDIGTVIAPFADAKLFITASVKVRAKRRYKELKKQGDKLSYDKIKKELKARDKRDKGRAISPLVPAKDAVIIDTDKMNKCQVFYEAAGIIGDKIALKKGTSR